MTSGWDLLQAARSATARDDTQAPPGVGTRGLTDLADWVDGPWVEDPQEQAEEWRSGAFFAQVPPAASSVEELAAWIRD